MKYEEDRRQLKGNLNKLFIIKYNLQTRLVNCTSIKRLIWWPHKSS